MSETRLVRLLPGPGRAVTGQVLRVTKSTADAWVESGIAEYAEPPRETAMLEVGRPAAPAKGRGRKVEQR